MPPKKANAKAKPTAAAAAATEVPDFITNKKGKEIETTAAAGRARRATAAPNPPASNPVKKAPAKKAAPGAQKAATKASATTTSTAGKKRGRPAKASGDDDDDEPAKKRGRPTGKAKAAVPSDEKAPPRKRGRPPHGGETTKIEEDDDAAADQLEEELVDVAGEAEGAATDAPRKEPSRTTKRGRGRPAKAQGATTSTVAANNALDEEEAEGAPAENASQQQFYLFKAEQEDREETLKDGTAFNTKFTIDDLREKGGPEPWDGVRNAAACKNMKEMNVGDLAFFYASGGKKGRQPGIVGIMEVVKEAEPDLSAFDENSYYYVENAKMRGTEQKPRWWMVHVEFRKKLSKPVTLKQLQKYAQGDGVLANMQEMKAARLSVSKVTEAEWNFIVEELIEGYEDDDVLQNGAKTADADATGASNGLVDGAATMGVKETIESEPPTTDSLLAPETVATSSRPASRAGLEKKASSRPGSRANSLAPPRGASRGRSRTPSTAPNGAQPAATTSKEKMDPIQE